MALYTIVIHGGAGVIPTLPGNQERLDRCHQGLREALEAGFLVLKRGGSSLDAVTRAVALLEDNPLFNAGKGSVFNAEGHHEMDAAVMRGDTLDCGSVAGVSNIRNPILLARAVMEQSGHVFLSGKGAEDFARQIGLSREPDAYFFTQERWDQWQQSQKDFRDQGKLSGKFGTVGAVAIDQQGNITSATSTGGMTNKIPGRIGDSPVIGAGTYANNTTCGISCSGHGEFFIRGVAAHDVSCLMQYAGLSLKEAMKLVVFEKIPGFGGSGGMIGVDGQGRGYIIFNTPGMYWGIQDSSGRGETAIFPDPLI